MGPLAAAAADASSDGGSNLAALYASLGAIGVALIGVIGNVLLRKRSTEPEDDMDVIRSLASALAAETDARKAAEQRALECEARENVRRPR